MLRGIPGLVLVLAVACGAPADVDGGLVDAGDDGARDASAGDGGTDSGRDAGPDGGPPDSGPPDAGPPPLRVVEVSGHCALRNDGEVRCWGAGTQGQLGHGELEDSEAAVRALLPGPATDISCSLSHCCAIVATQVWCWGANATGQVGRPFSETGFPYLHPTPVRAAYDGVAARVAAGPSGTCVIDGFGHLRCWGRQLTDAPALEQHEPRRVVLQDGSAPTEVAVGTESACVLATHASGGRGAFCFLRGAVFAVFFERECSAIMMRGAGIYCLHEGELYCWVQRDLDQCWDGLRRRPEWPPLEGFSGATSMHDSCVLFGDAEMACGGSTTRRALRPGTFDVAWPGGTRPQCPTNGDGVYCVSAGGSSDVAGVMD